MTKTMFEEVALGEYLCEWPEDMTYEEIIKEINDNPIRCPKGIEPIEYLEDWYPPTIAQNIESLKRTLEENFIGKINYDTVL